MQDQQLNQKMSQPRQESDYVRSVNKLDNKVKQLNVKKVYQRPNLM